MHVCNPYSLIYYLLIYGKGATPTTDVPDEIRAKLGVLEGDRIQSEAV
jgi:hypothetical protein